MTAGENYITLPNFLVPYRDGGVEDYTDAPETVGNIVLAVASKLFKGADISANLSPCERGVYRRWLRVAEDGLEKANREREKMRKASAVRWGKPESGEPPQAANPSGGRSPAPSAPVRRTVPQPSGGERRGDAVQIGECLNLSAMFGGAGGGIADRINADPVQAALEITGEPSGGLAENTLKKYLREKGRAAFVDELFAFNSELKNDKKPPDNMGAALNARLKALPDISGGKVAR